MAFKKFKARWQVLNMAVRFWVHLKNYVGTLQLDSDFFFEQHWQQMQPLKKMKILIKKKICLILYRVQVWISITKVCAEKSVDFSLNEIEMQKLNRDCTSIILLTPIKNLRVAIRSREHVKKVPLIFHKLDCFLLQSQ